VSRTTESSRLHDAPITDRHAAARSRIYALLAEAFSYPNGDGAKRLISGSLVSELAETAAALPQPIDLAGNISLPSDLSAPEEIQTRYSGLFDVCGSRPRVSLLERRYAERRNEPEQKLWEDLLRFYKHFGLDFAGGSVRENPDHLILQLDFLHYLTYLEACTGGASNDLRRGQRDFLARHLGRWAGLLAQKLGEESKATPYSSLAAFTSDFVAGEIEYLESLVGPGANDPEERHDPRFVPLVTTW
jgi:DMSO reductase family type II enzyme chaperone